MYRWEVVNGKFMACIIEDRFRWISLNEAQKMMSLRDLELGIERGYIDTKFVEDRETLFLDRNQIEEYNKKLVDLRRWKGP